MRSEWAFLSPSITDFGLFITKLVSILLSLRIFGSVARTSEAPQSRLGKQAGSDRRLKGRVTLQARIA